MSPMFTPLLVPFLAAMFLAINMGGSGTAPSFAVAYGAQLIRKDRIPGIFGVFVFLGAIIAGKWVIERLLGSGGMGRVYLGRQQKPSRAVAVKFMRLALYCWPSRLRHTPVRLRVEPSLRSRVSLSPLVVNRRASRPRTLRSAPEMGAYR